MKHWRIDQLDWDAFDPTRVDLDLLPIVKAASVVERNSLDYARYLNNIFVGDPDFAKAADEWAIEEVQHGDALGKWASLADPNWDYKGAFERYRAAYTIALDANASIRGSRTGELIARCMVETGTSSFYTALADSTDEPVLKAICKQIAADEFRHFKLFYDHMHRYLHRENLSVVKRAQIALSRILESEDDELASAFHTTNVEPGLAYDYERCIAGYMVRAIPRYQLSHIKRVVSMIFKTIGIRPHSMLQEVTAYFMFKFIQFKGWRFQRQLARNVTMPLRQGQAS